MAAGYIVMQEGNTLTQTKISGVEPGPLLTKISVHCVNNILETFFEES
jgi:hypothetical protein